MEAKMGNMKAGRVGKISDCQGGGERESPGSSLKISLLQKTGWSEVVGQIIQPFTWNFSTLGGGKRQTAESLLASVFEYGRGGGSNQNLGWDLSQRVAK